jgi:glycosyltransferase involved in cell wall biosynthesis
MVPREGFATGPDSIRSVCEHRENGARLVVVDAGSPDKVRTELERLAALHDFALVRVDRYLTPNQARNVGARHVTTPYVVFLDNNVQVSPGWLLALERCAAETGAAVVSPATITVELGTSVVHHVGGEAHVAERDGVRSLRNSHHHQGESTDGLRTVTRSVTEEAEFHCVLVDTSWLQKVGGLDEELLSLFEHTDLCMQVRAAGGTVWFEPDAVVSYGRPKFIDRGDRGYYVLRWSEEWNARSGKRFQAVWDLHEDPTPGVANWANTRRRYAYRPFTTPLNRLGRAGRPVVGFLDRRAQRRAIARWERSLRDASEPRIAHTASWQH